jgi:hypothetical protein
MIVALAITGFVTPGFFLSKESKPTDNSGASAPVAPALPSGTTAPDPNTGDARTIATQYVDAFNNSVNPDGSYNSDKFQASLDTQAKLACSDARPDIRALVRAADEVSGGAQLQITSNQPDPSNAANTAFTVISSIRKATYNIVVANEKNKFCVLGFTDQPQEIPDGQTAVTRMFAAIQAKDTAAANALSCSGDASENVDAIAQAINGAPSWQPDPRAPTPPSPKASPYINYFNGEVNGTRKSLVISASALIAQGWCVSGVSVR